MEIVGFTKKEIDNLLVFHKGGYEGKILLYNNELVLKQFEKHLSGIDVKPANILVNYNYHTKFIDVDSMGIDEYPPDHAEYRSHEAKLLQIIQLNLKQIVDRRCMEY